MSDRLHEPPEPTGLTGGRGGSSAPLNQRLNEINERIDAAVARRFGPNAIRTPANIVTVGRLVLTIPLLALIAREGASWLAAGAWVLLGVTDGIDGWLARRDGTTRSGAFLDPLADKVFTIGGLGALAWYGTFSWWPVALMGVRELAVSVFRTVLARRGVSLPARMLGKIKTNWQMVAVWLGLMPPTRDWHGFQSFAVWSAAVVTIVSGVQLVVGARRRPDEHVPEKA